MGVASMYDVFLISLLLFETVPFSFAHWLSGRWLASAIRDPSGSPIIFISPRRRTSVVVFVLSGGSNGDLHRRKWGIILGLNQATFV